MNFCYSHKPFSTPSSTAASSCTILWSYERFRVFSLVSVTQELALRQRLCPSCIFGRRREGAAAAAEQVAVLGLLFRVSLLLFCWSESCAVNLVANNLTWKIRLSRFHNEFWYLRCGGFHLREIVGWGGVLVLFFFFFFFRG